MAAASLGQAAKAKEMLAYYDARTGPSYSTGACKEISDHLHKSSTLVRARVSSLKVVLEQIWPRTPGKYNILRGTKRVGRVGVLAET